MVYSALSHARDSKAASTSIPKIGLALNYPKIVVLAGIFNGNKKKL